MWARGWGGGGDFSSQDPFLGQTLTFWEVTDQGKNSQWNTTGVGVGLPLLGSHSGGKVLGSISRN